MTPLKVSILVVQVLTFALLGAIFCLEGQWRLGIAQLMLAAVQAVIYSGGVS